MSDYDPYAPRPLSGLARGSHQLPGPPKKPTGTGRFKDGQEIVLSFQTLHNAEKFVAENPKDNLEVKPHGTTDDGDKVYYVVKKMDETFNIAWDLLKNFIGPREKVEEGKRMVEGKNVLYGQRKWDGVVIPEVLGYIDEEGNERDSSVAWNALLPTHPDANIRYRHDQDMSGERPPPFAWATLGGMPYPASVRDRYAKRTIRNHQEKIRREMMEARDRALRNRMKERKSDE